MTIEIKGIGAVLITFALLFDLAINLMRFILFIIGKVR
jgi:hypothetical protein